MFYTKQPTTPLDSEVLLDFELEQMAEQLKDAYRSHKSPGWRPTSASIKKQFDTAAARAAIECYNNRIDPYLWVAALMEHHKNHTPTRSFFPGNIWHPEGVAISRRHALGSTKKTCEDYVLLYQQQEEWLKRYLINRNYRKVLLDEMLPLTSWFRVCVTKEPDLEIMNKFGAHAKEQLDKELLECLKQLNLDFNRILSYGLK